MRISRAGPTLRLPSRQVWPRWAGSKACAAGDHVWAWHTAVAARVAPTSLVWAPLAPRARRAGQRAARQANHGCRLEPTVRGAPLRSDDALKHRLFTREMPAAQPCSALCRWRLGSARVLDTCQVTWSTPRVTGRIHARLRSRPGPRERLQLSADSRRLRPQLPIRGGRALRNANRWQAGLRHRHPSLRSSRLREAGRG